MDLEHSFFWEWFFTYKILIPPEESQQIPCMGLISWLLRAEGAHKTARRASAIFFFTNQVKYIYFKNIFGEIFFIIIQTNTPRLLCEKYEIIMSITKWAETIYKKAKKNRPDLSV